MSRRLDALRAEFTLVRTAIDEIETRATTENRELTDEEQTDTASLFARAEALTPEIEQIVRREESLSATAETMARVGATPPAITTTATEIVAARTQGREFKMTPGQYLAQVGEAMVRGDQEAIDSLQRMILPPDELARTIATPTVASQAAGVVPEFIIGDVVKFVFNQRPTVGAMRTMPMPAKGKKFNRPRLTVRNAVGVQATEFAEVSSAALTLVDDEVTKVTLGGAVDISEQDIDWTEPSFLDIVVQDLAEVYAVATEQYAAYSIVNAITTNFKNIAGTTAANFQSDLGSIAGSLFNNAKQLPDVLFVAVDRWAYLVGLTDTTGRPVFPNLGPQNAPGQLNLGTFNGNPMGVNLVVSPALPTGFMALGVSQFLEFYEQDKGQASIIQPGNLSVRFAYRGYVAANVYGKGLYGLFNDSSTSYHTQISQ